MENNIEKKIECVTGNRPKGLPWKYNEGDIRCIKCKQEIKNILLNDINEGFNYFISGMALGIDMIFAEIVLQLRVVYPHIKLECAIPCINQTEKWFQKDINRYNSILNNADKVTYVSSSEYYNGCMEKRNQYMVNQSNKVLAVFNGQIGGTSQTIKYAQENSKTVEIIDINKFNY